MTRRVILSMIALFPGLLTAQESYSPYVGQAYPNRVYWGDTHLHTSLSRDAYLFGARVTADEAYRLAKAETVVASNGMKLRLHRPLDFLVVADHAENLGEMIALEAQDPRFVTSEALRRLAARVENINQAAKLDSAKAEQLSLQMFWEGHSKGNQGNDAFIRSVWQQVAFNADRHNDPGRFTAFIGYEWSSFGQRSAGIHRVVIFKDGANRATRILPFSMYDGADPEALWNFLADYERMTGGEALAIPHNGNLSKGEMFAPTDFRGKALSARYAERRSRWEPLYEVTQIKGNGETHPALSPTDEFANYEIWESGAAAQDTRYEYARSALLAGLEQQAVLGVNAFKFGLIGSTDAHTGLSAVEENNFWGKTAVNNPQPLRLSRKLGALSTETAWSRSRAEAGLAPMPDFFAWTMASSGYAAVWATDNTREALFAAMKRKETYASTGPRITVRFFGGWDYAPEDALRPDLALLGYRKGVPMGGDLTNAPVGRSPSFLIRAVKDAHGANLDRVQVIKGWRDRKGELQERVHDVALSDNRKLGVQNKAPRVSSTVDVANASYTNTVGDPELAVVWIDPDFDPQEPAFYYARVIEIPTPRWTAYDAKYFGIKDVPAEVPMVTQERAYTSPIWFLPKPH